MSNIKIFESDARYLPAVIMDNLAEILYDSMDLNLWRNADRL